MKLRKIPLTIFVTTLVAPLIFSCSSIKAESLTIKGDYKIDIGQTSSFSSEVLPKTTTDKKVNWVSSNPDIAFVDSNGNVTGVNPGRATITASCADNSGKKATQDVLIGGHISTHVNSISFSQKAAELEIGNYFDYQMIVSPSNADDQTITYTSSNPEQVSVTKEGYIKADAPTSNPVTITAVSKDGNHKDECKISVKSVTPETRRKVKGFSIPDCLVNFNNKVKASENTIDETTINRNNSSNYINGNFYKTEETPIYKVGTANAFKFKGKVSWAKESSTFQDYTDDNPFQTYKTYEYNGNAWSEKNIVESHNTQKNEFVFNKGAIDFNKKYKLTVWPDKDYFVDLSGGTESLPSISIEFKFIEDGYNAYSFEDFVEIDNWSEAYAKKILGESHSVFTNKEFRDPWAQYRNKSEPTGGYKAVILHNNITITSNELTDNLKWTTHETEDYINGVKLKATKEEFDQYVEIKESIHQEEWKSLSDAAKRAKCRYILEGSVKDEAQLFFRYTENDKTFILEGNYFNIDAYNIKPVALFSKQTLNNYQKVATHVSTLFSFGASGSHSKTSQAGEPVYDDFLPYRSSPLKEKNNNIVRNLNIRGNAHKSETDDEGIGGLNMFGVNCNTTIENIIGHEFSNGVYCRRYNDLIMSTSINSCKFFDMFDSFLRSYGYEAINVKDSIFKDAGGQGMTLFEHALNGKHWPCTVNLDNTYIECFVSGNEVYNMGNFGHYIIKLLANIGYNAFEKYKGVKYGLNGKYAPENPANFIKIEDDQVKINYIAYHNYSPFDSSEVVGKGRTKVISTNHKHKEIGVRDVINIEKHNQEDSPIYAYNQMDPLSPAHLSFISNVGGHARIPLLSVAEANDLEVYDSQIDPSSSYNQTMNLSYYVENKDSVDKSLENLTKTMGNLFSGDYLTCYMTSIANDLMGFGLGYK